MSDNSLNEDLQKELIKDLIIESIEGLDIYDRELLDLEKDCSLETMNVIFRVIHTIKGTAGCLGLGKIETLAHSGENLLSLLRDGELDSNEAMITSLLALSDALRAMLQTLEETGNEGDHDHSALMKKLENHQRKKHAASDENDQAFGLFEEEETALETATHNPSVEASIPTQEQAATVDNATVISAGKPSIADSAIRVDVSQLDKVMNMVGELVLARNQIIANTTNFDEAALQKASQRLNLITTELQESVMKTRMQPIGNVWSKFPRIVRDVSTELGKRVRLIMDGKDTELDRTIIEAIKDPLTHIVRNSIDHGIEPPEARAKSGKSEEGLLSLRAFHEGGQVIIEIMDDGAGIDLAQVKAKAVQKNLILASKAEKLSEREAINLIFKPGFSTASKVSNVSGRGVGMDVVKTNIEKIGGSVDIQMQPHQGTTLKIKIPLTLAIIPALIVTSGGDRYAIPQVSLLELVRLEGSQAKKKIEMLYGTPVYRLRGQLLPLAFLNDQFNFSSLEKEIEKGLEEDRVISIVVLQADGRQFGLVVDEINDTEEIVVKPLGQQLKKISCFAGSTIMGDGKIALILDVMGLALHAKVLTESQDQTIIDDDHKSDSGQQQKQNILLFNVDQKRRMAIPLSMAARLEEFPTEKIEHTGTQEVVQYRGQILPLIRVIDSIENDGTASHDQLTELMQVVVYSEEGHSVGLVVQSINDIVEEEVDIKRKSASQGVLGSAIIQGSVTDFLDVPEVIRSANPSFYSHAS